MAGSMYLLLLEELKESIPPSIIGEEGYIRMKPVLESLPFDFSTFWGFECRLGMPEPLVDVLFEVRREGYGQKLLSGKVDSPLDGLCKSRAAWKRIRKFTEAWMDEEVFQKRIKNIWLEFDTSCSDPYKVIENPSFFFGPDAKILDGESVAVLVEDVLGILKERSLPPSLFKLTSLLPDGAKLFQVGLMWSRKNDFLRVCVKNMQKEELAEILESMGWEGDVKSLKRWIGEVSSLVKDITIDLDLVGNGVGSKIGVECYMDWRYAGPEEWKPLLDYLEKSSLCLPEKAKGVLSFNGMNYPSKRFARSERGVIYPGLYRRLHHIKVNLEGDVPTEAKAYLAVKRPGVITSEEVAKERDHWMVE